MPFLLCLRHDHDHVIDTPEYYLNYTIPYALPAFTYYNSFSGYLLLLLSSAAPPPPPRHLKHLFLFIALSFFVLSISPAIRTDLPSGLIIRLE